MLNQSFPIFYQNRRFLVDPILLSNACKRFHDLINSNLEEIQSPCLRINCNIFSIENVSNFLMICQNQQTEMPNSEMKEICLLAKMFQADEIFDRACDFIKNEIDDSYVIPSDQLDKVYNTQNLILESEANAIQSAFIFDLSDLDFDESCEQIEANNEVYNNNNKKVKKNSVCYQIKEEKPLFKCRRFYLLKENEVIYTAKQRFEKIFIGEGKNCHLKKNKQLNVASITREFKGYNIAKFHNQEFKIKYSKIGKKYLVKTSFDHKLGRQMWRPKEDNFQGIIKGEYNHKPIKSNKNLVLQNERNRPTFILRKMGKKVYETECSNEAEPVVIFSIAISQIIGPITA